MQALRRRLGARLTSLGSLEFLPPSADLLPPPNFPRILASGVLAIPIAPQFVESIAIPLAPLSRHRAPHARDVSCGSSRTGHRISLLRAECVRPPIPSTQPRPAISPSCADVDGGIAGPLDATQRIGHTPACSLGLRASQRLPVGVRASPPSVEHVPRPLVDASSVRRTRDLSPAASLDPWPACANSRPCV